LIYGDGMIFDLYSFQDSLRGLMDIMVYAARAGQLVSSLQLIADQKPGFSDPFKGTHYQQP